jgi:hypothetical protein
MACGAIAFISSASTRYAAEPSSIFITTVPGYRDWKLISELAARESFFCLLDDQVKRHAECIACQFDLLF